MGRFMGNRFGNNPATPVSGSDAETAVYSMSDQYAMVTDNGWVAIPNPSITASGGTTGTYTDGPATYKYHLFTSDNNFVISQLASGAGAQPNQVDVLLVAGGGGSEPGNASGGGGGGGGLLEGTLTFSSAGTYPIVIGGGGPNSNTGTGSPSTFCGCTADGGGGGQNNAAGLPGGSGGGGSPGGGGGSATQSPQDAAVSGVSGTLTGYGFNGMSTTPGNVGGGGGGAGGVGGPTAGPYPWNPGPDGTTGGPGRENSILNGTPYYWAGGGGGGVSSGRDGGGGAGGGGGGGNGTPGLGARSAPNPLQSYNAGDDKSGASGGNGGTNTGGGGGGIGNSSADGGQGGSGICVVRYRTA